MTSMTKTTPVYLRLILSLISIILSCNLSFGENEYTIGSKRLIPALEVTSSLTSSDISTDYFFMEDTVCTSVIRDTFYVNTLPNIDSYAWTIPNGANIVSTIGDTMIIVDWTNAVPGLADICIETMNNCGVSTPVCFPIRIIVCNLMPNAVDDQRTTPPNTPILVTVQSNDSDPDNDQLTTGLDLSDVPDNGSVNIIGNDIRYTPDLNFTGTDVFQYYICDDGSPMFCDTAVVTIIVENSPPIAIPDVVSTVAGLAVTIPVQDNDSDPENHDLTTTLDGSNTPTQGAVIIDGDNIIYTPNVNATGSDEFGYVICDNGNPILCDSTTVTVNLNNQAPLAVNDRDTTLSNQPILINVQNNDSDPEGNDLITSLQPLSPPTNGTVTVIGDNVQYTPNADYKGNDSFDYIICDNGAPSLCDTATVDIVVLNQAPIALNDLASTPSGVPVTIPVQDNDSDPENGILTTTLDNNNGPNNGTVAVNGTGIIYTPGLGFSGSDSFDYIICDDGTPILCDTATVTISTENQAPVAVADVYTTPFETAITLNVQDNDNDPENGVLTTTLNPSFPPTNGTVSIVNGDSIVYTPNMDFLGTDQFGYIICDDGTPILCDTTMVTITVPNDRPVAIDDTNNTMEDTPISGTILNNDFDPNGNDLILNLVLISSPSNGSINLNPNGSYTYTPNANYNGGDTFLYQICDNQTPSLCDTGEVSILINPVNDAPIAMDDSNGTTEDTPVSGAVLPNDSDPENDDLTVSTTPIAEPDNGSVTLNPNGTYTYTPDPGFNGNDSFQYEVCDDGTPSQCDTATVTIAIGAVNDPPMAMDDPFTTAEDMPVMGTLVGNDSDPENDNLTVSTTPVDEPDNGTLTLNPDGTFTYTPDPEFEGTDTFQYEVCDDGIPSQCDTATVTITVNPVNDAPLAMDDSNSTNEDTPVSGAVLPNDSDPENDDLTVSTTPIAEPDNGSVTLNPNGTYTYTPDPGFNGNDSFQYEVCDDGTPSQCDTATVTIAIGAVNDPPMAMDDPFTTAEDMPVMGTLVGNDSDPENDNLTVSTTPVDEPDNGTLTLNPDGTFTYTPDPEFEGTDTFQYEVCDDGIPSQCDTATVTITVNPVNDAPLAMDDSNSTNEDTPVDGAVLPNDSDPENDDLTVSTTPIAEPDNGSVTLNPNGTYTYTPDPGFNGNDSFQYEVCDDGTPSQCDTATVTIAIGAVNDPPMAMDDPFTTAEDMPVMGTLVGNDSDPENDNLTVSTTPVDEPDNGTLTLNPDGTFTYTPDPEFEGTDTFQYEVCDDGIPSQCDTATVTITVNPVNDAPLAMDDSNSTNEDTPVDGAVLPNDSDPENDDLTVSTTPIAEPDNGSVTLNPNGTYTYTPDPGFNGNDSFQYEVCDDGTPSQCDTATVTIAIGAVNDPPMAMDDSNSTNEDTPVDGAVLPNDSDPENDDLTVNTTPIDEPDNGSVTLNPNGTYTYTPNPGFNGNDSFQYEVCDDGTPSQCDTATVIITVNPVNDAPIAVDDSFPLEEDTPLMDTVLPNDSDPDGDNITVTTTPIAAPDNGTLTLNPDGTFTYMPNPAFNGQDTFLYELCDTGIPKLCDTAQVIIVIDPENDPPVAVDDIVVTPINELAQGNLLTNDFDPEGDNITVNTTPVDSPENGALTINPDGTYTYTPNPNFVGEDSFLYEICDDGIPSQCDTATVVIYIIEDNSGVNDPPVAINDNFVTNMNEPIIAVNLMTNDVDPDGDDLILNTAPINPPTNGAVFILPNGDATYTPATDYIGEDVFTYRICDNGTPVLCDTATVSITILPSTLLENSTYANDDAGLTYQDVPLTGILNDNDNDPEGDNQFLQTTPVTPTSNGSIVLNNDGSFLYIPNSGYVGADLFVYQLCDDGTPVACDLATVYLTVLERNKVPYAIDDVNIIPKNDTARGNLLANDFDLDGDNIIIAITPIDPTDNGNITIHPDGTYTYIPNPDYVGEDIFTYRICDDGTPIKCDTATVTIEIIENNPAVNDPPVGVNDVFITLIDMPVESNIVANDFDPDGDNISISTFPTSQPENGTVVINSDGTFEYVPNLGFSGDDYFNYQICDDQTPSLCTEAVVSITIIPPVDGINFTFANDDAANTDEDTPISGDLLANDTDPEGHTQSINPTPVNQPEHGTVIINFDGTYTYTPAPDYEGADQFTYILCDNGTPSACDEAVVYLVVNGENDPPLAIDDINNTIKNMPTCGFVLTNDTELEGDGLVLNTTPVVASANGTVSLNEDGKYTYTPDTDFVGEDSFEYVVCDDQTPALCDTAKVVIEVLDFNPLVNNPPNGVEDNVQTNVNTPVIGSLLSNDSDIDGDNLVIMTTPIETPNNGELIINPDGTFEYTPNPEFAGEDTFTYEVCDDGTPSLCDEVTVTITVTPNPFDENRVFASDDAGSLQEDQTFTGNLLDNDNDPEGDNLVITTLPVTLPQNGLLTINTDGTFDYLPYGNFYGVDHFQYEVCDDKTPKACDTANVYLSILPLQDPPLAKDDINLTLVNTPVTGLVFNQ